MNKKLVILIAVFLLLVPFRLPIGVLFINLVTGIANLTGNLSNDILVPNVVVTKIIYDIALGSISVYNLEMLSRSIKGRQATTSDSYDSKELCYWWVIPVGILLFVYSVFDAFSTHELFYELLK